MTHLEFSKIEDLLSKDYVLVKFPFWKYLFKKSKMIMIRPKLPNDDYTELFSYDAAELVKNRAIAKNIKVIDLGKNDASREKVTTNIGEEDPDFVCHYDHGGTYTLWGQEDNAIEAAIDTNNVDLLKGRAVSTVSCLSAGGLGPSAISACAKAYLGYDDLHWVHLWYIDEFTEAANEANYALLEGDNFGVAYKRGYDKYTEKYQELVALGADYAAALMLHDRDHFVRLGDYYATAH
jgi:hypothetical protein